MRYVVVEGSESAHCCFDATVVDTNRPIHAEDSYRMKNGYEQQYEAVCECFEMKDAEVIAAALNASAQ